MLALTKLVMFIADFINIVFNDRNDTIAAIKNTYQQGNNIGKRFIYQSFRMLLSVKPWGLRYGHFRLLNCYYVIFVLSTVIGKNTNFYSEASLSKTLFIFLTQIKLFRINACIKTGLSARFCFQLIMNNRSKPIIFCC